MKKNICHITTVHPRNDIRIFHKECKSLSKEYNVNLIVADGLGDEVKSNIRIYDIGKRQSSRLKRAKIDSVKALQKALEIDAEVFHFHDPELVRIGVKLKNNQKKVIYDVHEDLPRQIYGKPYIHKFVKPIIASIVEWQENKAARQFDYICAATPFIRDRFRNINKNTIDINNYPILGELFNGENNKINNQFCYTGLITKERGLKEIIDSFEFVDAELVLAGSFDNQSFYDELTQSKGWKNIIYKGNVNRNELKTIMSSSIAGLVLFLSSPNHVNSQPNKMFEYMSAKIPVIGSDFPLWKEIIEKNKCGICVDPSKPDKIADAINYLLNNPEATKAMGENGQKAVFEKYNWKNEEKKLLDVYQKILKG